MFRRYQNLDVVNQAISATHLLNKYKDTFDQSEERVHALSNDERQRLLRIQTRPKLLPLMNPQDRAIFLERMQEKVDDFQMRYVLAYGKEKQDTISNLLFFKKFDAPNAPQYKSLFKRLGGIKEIDKYISYITDKTTEELTNAGGRLPGYRAAMAPPSPRAASSTATAACSPRPVTAPPLTPMCCTASTRCSRSWPTRRAPPSTRCVCARRREEACGSR